MKAAPRPLRLAGVEEGADCGGDRLPRIMGRQTLSDRVSAIVEEAGPDGTERMRVTWIDATTAMPASHARSAVIVHLLWTKGGKGVDLGAGHDPDADDGLRQFEVHPGDTTVIPGQVPFSLGAGALAITVSSTPIERGWLDPVSAAFPLPPTHGLQVFERFNRRTFCGVAGDLVLERWKLTQIQKLRLDPGRLHLVVNLVDPVAAAWPGGSGLLERARSYVLPRGQQSLTLVPDNLGYVLLAYHGDPARDVIEPLRHAGYAPDAIASIGVQRRDAN